MEFKLPFTTKYETETNDIILKIQKLHFQNVFSSNPEDFSDNNLQIAFNQDYIGQHKGISQSAIAIILSEYYEDIEAHHKQIIATYKSDIAEPEKQSIILHLVNKLNDYIEDNIYELSFQYPQDLTEDLNYLHERTDWLDNNDPIAVKYALEAFVEIEYYNQWMERHKIPLKKFQETMKIIENNLDEVKKYGGNITKELNNKPTNTHNNLRFPRHPQNIIYSLYENYYDYYGKEYDTSFIQDTIPIISSYKRAPKRPTVRETDLIHLEKSQNIYNKMKENGATEKELSVYFLKNIAPKQSELFISGATKGIKVKK